MKGIILKLLIKLVRLNISNDLGVVDRDKLQKWLYVSYKDDGWKQYYTLRKKSLLQLLSLGAGNDEEYWKIVGRMAELKALSNNITGEVDRRKKIKKKIEQLKDI